jgi:small conductance mechanosensitive channel
MEFDTATITTFAVDYGIKIIAALATLVIGLYVVSIIRSVIMKVFERSKVDPSLRTFLSSMIAVLLKVLVYITALGVLGIEMTSFIAILGAAGLAVGMALSGTLQNFAGGVMILLFKPYKVGDVIEAQG